jgi:hypothetical protein
LSKYAGQAADEINGFNAISVMNGCRRESYMYDSYDGREP